MAQKKTGGATDTGRRTVRRAASEPGKNRGAARSLADAAPTDALEDIQDRGDEAATTSLDQARGTAGNTLGQVAPGSGDQLSVRDELAAIARETTIEILGPVVRNATKQAAKFVATRGPELMARSVAPRIRDSVMPAIEEAGGPGALARGAVSNVSDQREKLLSKVGLGKDRGRSAALPGTEGWRVPLEESVDVAVPLERAYDQFSRFEEFAKFISQGETVDERPDERIEWKSRNGAKASGVITFHRLSDRLTRVMVTYDVQPHGVLERAGSALRMSGRALRTDLMRYKAFVEMADEGEDTELDERTDEVELERGRKRPAPRSSAEEAEEDLDADEEADEDLDEESDEADDAYDQAEDDLDEDDDETQGDDEEQDAAPPTRAVRRRAPARPRQKARQRR